ncbi:MAG: tRNA preQ1(34) S-adenosylmethionine ribosyltransferase-isomerase QueA [Phycisphaeraceae bacterium]|nr:tRNA preQ1(34) S-adenosylmethionine ribosyltransferase-isomerase QueA [Phycisphaeraceae bacterium]
MRIEELDYPLPADRIAIEPAQPRDAARLLVVDRQSGRVEHLHVRDLPGIVGGPGPGDLMVFNRSRVLPARFEGLRAKTSGRVEGLYLETCRPGPAEPVQWRVMLEARGSLREGEQIQLLDHDGQKTVSIQLLTKCGSGQWLATPPEAVPPPPEAALSTSRARQQAVQRCPVPEAVQSPQGIDALAILDRIGQPPLPPYIRKARKTAGRSEWDSADAQRYNTVYAREPGSVAAPTAGLHFTESLLANLSASGVNRADVTLHVGLGTFAPIRATTLQEHLMHEELMSVPAATIQALADTRQRGGRIIPVGTTSVRALESLPALRSPEWQAALTQGYATSTQLFIRPADEGQAGFAFRFADALLTNFHLPRSTLLALVAALPGVGLAQLKAWYALAVAEGYRFYSFGDAMLIV